jgi:hypothetical protein
MTTLLDTAAEAIEAALDGSGFPWSRRPPDWPIAMKERLPREILVSPAPGGAGVRAVLAEWDDIAPACSEALALFLRAAQQGLRFARCEIDERQARVVAFAAAASLDADLPHALLGVAAGCELLAREAAALLLPEVAQMYLAFRRMPWTGAGADRTDGHSPGTGPAGASRPQEPEGR